MNEWKEGQSVYLIRKDKTIQKGLIVKDSGNKLCLIPPDFVKSEYQPKLPLEELDIHIYKSMEEAEQVLLDNIEQVGETLHPTKEVVINELLKEWKKSQPDYKVKIMENRIKTLFGIKE